jgi:hypothetical protein
MPKPIIDGCSHVLINGAWYTDFTSLAIEEMGLSGIVAAMILVGLAGIL